MNDMSLDGKQALVIGGSSGIGLAIAKGLQRAGSRVSILARTPDKVETAIRLLQENDAGATGFTGDAADISGLATLIGTVESQIGVPDILVNSQGTTVIKPAVDFTEADYDQVVDTNMKSLFFTCTGFGRGMIEKGAGSIINIASLAAHRGWPSAAAYSASKHGVVGITKSLAGEWAEHGVRVNAISPGFFLTELNRDKMPAARKERALSRTPLGRFGEVDELAGAAIYLASSAAAFVTGTVIEVDGGYLGVGI